MKKTFLAIITVMAILFTMTACGGTTTPSASDAPAQPAAPQAQDAGSEPVSEPVGGAFTIGFSFPTSNNEFWQNAVNYFKMASSDLGFTPLSDDCNGDTAEQLSDVETMISSGINALVLAPQDSSVVPGILNACNEKSIPVVIIDRLPDEDIVAGEDYIAFIGPNDEEAG